MKGRKKEDADSRRPHELLHCSLLSPYRTTHLRLLCHLCLTDVISSVSSAPPPPLFSVCFLMCVILFVFEMVYVMFFCNH